MEAASPAPPSAMETAPTGINNWEAPAVPDLSPRPAKAPLSGNMRSAANRRAAAAMLLLPERGAIGRGVSIGPTASSPAPPCRLLFADDHQLQRFLTKVDSICFLMIRRPP